MRPEENISGIEVWTDFEQPTCDHEWGFAHNPYAAETWHAFTFGEIEGAFRELRCHKCQAMSIMAGIFKEENDE